VAAILKTGQIACYSIGDDGDVEAGVDKAYTVIATAGNTDIEVAHYANNGISFVAPNTVNDAGAGLVTILATDRIRIKGAVNPANNGVFNVLAGGVAGTFTTVQNTIVNEGAGTVVSLYKVAALSNEVVQDTKTGLMWARYTSNGLRVGVLSTGLLNWYDVATRFTIYAGANTVSVIMPGNIFRITGGAALTQFHAGDCIMAAGFANAVNLLPNYYVVSAVANAGNLDITVNPGNEVLIGEGAVGDTIYLNCRSIYNYAAGANGGALSTYTDWVPPNDAELVMLMHQEAPNNLPDAIAFPGWSTGYHWSSTTRASNTIHAVMSSFSGAEHMITILKTSAFLTALVRHP